MPSLADVPVSCRKAMDRAAGAALSSVKFRAALTADTLPATSLWRACTWLAPSVAVNVLVQVLPPSTLYSTRAPVSMPVALMAPNCVN